jgi:aryl-alcohol dehydrogenase-like predicted oxidoreductase
LGEEEILKRMSVNDGVMVNRVGLSRKHIFDAVDASIARLGTYLDILQIHRLDRETSREEIMKALNDVVESGKVRYIGACTVSVSNSSLIELHHAKGFGSDENVGVPILAEHRQAERLARVHLHARLLQLVVS